MVNVLVVDDHSLMRRAIREVVDKEEGMSVVAEASNGEEAEIQAAQTQPDVVIMDVDMPDCNGFEATERVLACSPHSRVVIFTPSHQEQLVFQALQKGAMGYITKDIEPDELIHAIRCAARNDLCIPGEFATQILAQLRSYWQTNAPYASFLSSSVPFRAPRRRRKAAISSEGIPDDIEAHQLAEELDLVKMPRPLTERERQILDLMRKGCKNREIAHDLEIAESTVHKHVQNIFEKLHARNRTEAIYLTSLENE